MTSQPLGSFKPALGVSTLPKVPQPKRVTGISLSQNSDGSVVLEGWGRSTKFIY